MGGQGTPPQNKNLICWTLGLKTSTLQKNTNKKMKRQATDWEKTSVKHLCDKGLVSKIYKKT